LDISFPGSVERISRRLEAPRVSRIRFLAAWRSWTKGTASVIRSVGRIGALEEKIKETHPTNGSVKCGIGHTRWATHGRPSETNSHPHRDCTGRFYVAHNGIIEKLSVSQASSDWPKDTRFKPRPIPRSCLHLIESYYEGDLEQAVRRTLRDIEGIYGIVVVSTEVTGRKILLAGA